MATPRYEEIAEDLAARISGDEFPAGSTLPGYKELASEYNVSKATIEKALGLLEAGGLVRPVKRGGLRVRHPGPRRVIGTAIDRHPSRGYVFPSASSASERWQLHGRPQVVELPVPGAVAERLGIPEGTLAVRRRMVTSPAGEGPYQVSNDWVHPDLFQQIPQLGDQLIGPGGMLDLTELAGHGPLTWHRHTRARQPDTDEAQLLEIPPALWVVEMAYVAVSGQTGRPVAVSVRVVPADRVELADTMRRTAAARQPVTPIEPLSEAIALG
ncbi:GntR family transcriptional regulator [Streptomyces scabiei]|uniref:GntR family transcriptional regulator n=1 Tax=Streptomyces scabiei TaxID=1930 RepID=UPI0029907E5E|nr:GntR family transcriptional regulator [Streptomyces scabiei]MDW8803670.1 GntR family transcriptional regulator [Streptomyces scabiei]